jgi:hypothetical protein
MPPSNSSGLFQLFSGDQKDGLTRLMQTVGKIAFSIAITSALCGQFLYKIVTTHKVLEIIVGIGAGGGIFLGLFMFIGVGARVMGEQAGVTSFGGQIFRILWRTFLFLLLPCLLLSLLLILIIKPH